MRHSDGVEADLGNFGAVVYRKITNDAKRQSFQGFRPGTIPPHLLPTYKAFAMDEVAREAALEAMQQNNIRPFESARAEMLIEQISIPPKAKKSKKSKKKKKNASAEPQVEETEEAIPAWETYATMKEALKAGWEVSWTWYICASFIPLNSPFTRNEHDSSSCQYSQDKVSALLQRTAKVKRSSQ